MAYKEFRTAANVDPQPVAARNRTEAKRGKDTKDMGRIIRFLLLLIVLGVLGLIGYSYSGYLVPEQTTVTTPVELDVD
jgi:hypothetical protein